MFISNLLLCLLVFILFIIHDKIMYTHFVVQTNFLSSKELYETFSLIINRAQKFV